MHRPRCTLAELIEFVADYQSTDKREILWMCNESQWHQYKLPYLFATFMQIYLTQRINKQSIFDPYCEQLPNVGDIQQSYKPYLDHILSQIKVNKRGNMDINDISKNIHIYMNKPILMGPIKTLSMKQLDLLIFGYVHTFQHQNNFYSQIIPWDVITIIHSYFQSVNKEYFEKCTNIKRNIIEIESQIKNGTNHIVFEKQQELFSLYNKYRNITFDEEYHPYLIDEYIINDKQYQLSVKEFLSKISSMDYTNLK